MTDFSMPPFPDGMGWYPEKEPGTWLLTLTDALLTLPDMYPNCTVRERFVMECNSPRMKKLLGLEPVGMH